MLEIPHALALSGRAALALAGAGFALFLLGLFWLVGTYNGLVRLRTRVKEAWSRIDVELKRRYDLIPDLASAVRAHAKSAAQAPGAVEAVAGVDAVARSRSLAIEARGVKDLAAAERSLTAGLRKVFALADAHPDLGASPRLAQIRADLAGVEERIGAARRQYDENALRYNDRIAVGATRVVADLFNFKPEELFEGE
jgi:LemA protein